MDHSPMRALQALRGRVDDFFQAAADRGGSALQCAHGCHGCCHVDLSVGCAEADSIKASLDALPEPALEALRARALDPGETPHAFGDGPPCVMLHTDGACAIYESRPMICRTQGLALRYPRGVIPTESLSAKATDESDLTWCPLNYLEAAPHSNDILDAELVDRLLGQINSKAASLTGSAEDTRRSLRHLVLLQKAL